MVLLPRKKKKWPKTRDGVKINTTARTLSELDVNKMSTFIPKDLAVQQEHLPLKVASFPQDTGKQPGPGRKVKTRETTEKEKKSESGWCLECSCYIVKL